MNRINRRAFLGSAAVSTVYTGLWANSAKSAGTDIVMGLIGCGWYGMVDVKAALKVGGVKIAAICDVDTEHLKKSADEIEKIQGSRPREFTDYRKMLEVSELQAVIIASPPHWHALQFIDSLKRGLDIYCEKPLSYDIREGQAMVKAAEKAGKIVQIGFQRRQSPALRQAREYIGAGNIGKVIQAEAQIHYNAGILDTTPQQPPESLDWDQWCGPAVKLPYCPQIGHKAWRLEKEYGHGHLVDWGIHLIDATRWILGESMPKRVQASGGIYYHKNKITTPDILNVHFEFETCPVAWRHRIWGAGEYDDSIKNGIFFYGEKATVFATDRKWIIIPKDGKEQKIHNIGDDMGKLHMSQFLESVKTRQQPMCSTEDGHYSTATVKLAMISLETGCKVDWDTKKQNITNDRNAARLLKRQYRKPWIHPWQG